MTSRFLTILQSMSNKFDLDEDLEKMKSRLCSLFHCGRNSMSNSNQKRKLILHFDVNKTLVPVDSATGETIEAALNVFLSGMAWGKDRQGEWYSKELLSSAPLEVDDVSFYKFVEKRLLPNVTRDRKAFRVQLMSFTDEPQGSNFKPYLNELLQTLRWKLPYDENLHKALTVPGTKECRYHFIIPAFYSLLRHLVAEQRDFAIIFRTYGNDVKNVLTSVKTAIKQSLPFSDNLAGLADGISENVYCVKRDPVNSEKFFLHSECSNKNGASGDYDTCQMTDDDMYTWFTNLNGFCAIHDNVQDWYKNNFDSKHGKPFWVDLNDPDVQHIFFDDNIRPGNFDSILNIRVRDNRRNTGSRFRVVGRDEEFLFEHSNAVPVNFPEAILNENYFIDKLHDCERNYSERLTAFERD